MKSRNPWVLMTLLLLPLLMMGRLSSVASAAAAASAAGRLEISLAQCVEGYIAGSDAVRTAEKKTADSAEAYRRAVAEKKAALSLTELKISAEAAELALAEARNNAAIQGVQAYIGLAQAARRRASTPRRCGREADAAEAPRPDYQRYRLQQENAYCCEGRRNPGGR